MSNCHCNTDIILDGSGQLGRYLKALDPTYAPVDDRSIEDLLVFAKRYAAQIRFYDIPETDVEEDTNPEKISWREFFRRDMAVINASVAVLDITGIKKDYDDVRNELEEDPSAEKLKALYSISIGMANRIDRWYSVAIPGNPFQTDLKLAINSHLKWQMKRILAYEDGYKFIDTKKPFDLDFSGIQNDEIWGLNETVDPDASIYEGNNPEDKIRSGALYADEIFNDFYSSLQGFIDKGPVYMNFALEQYPAHQPHMALFITFLQVFHLAQKQMNGLTGRMLDFYYQDVLQLSPKDSIPDNAHIVFELAKGTAQYNVAAGTLLSAGKDASGKEQHYKTKNDFVVNQAKVKELKTIFVEKEAILATANAPASGFAIKNLYASPVANSANGFGEPFTVDNPKWPTFGKGKSVTVNLTNPCKRLEDIKEDLLTVPVAQTGFAIASPQLVLQGGKRLLSLQVPGIGNFIKGGSGGKNAEAFEIWLTGEKEWLKINRLMSNEEKVVFTKYFIEGLGIFNPDDAGIETSYFLKDDTFYIYLPIAESPVIAFDAKLHTGYNYKTNYPVMQVMLNGDMRISESDYKNLKTGDIKLDIQVGSVNPAEKAKKEIEKKLKISIPDFHFDGLQTLVIQNADGIIAAGKPFNPFTAYPGRGKSLYIGSEEIFNKPLGKLSVNLKRTKDDSGLTAKEIKNSGSMMLAMSASAVHSNSPFRVNVLANRNWKRLSDADGSDFSLGSMAANILQEVKQVNPDVREIVPVNLDRLPLDKITEWKIQSIKGFVRIDLNAEIFRGDGQTALQASQEAAPELEMKELSVSYHSSLEKLQSNTDQFFHVYPFGVVETYIKSDKIDEKGLSSYIDAGFASLDKQKNYLLVDAGNLLLPQYTFLNSYINSLSAKTSEEDVVAKSRRSQLFLNNLVLSTSGIRQKLNGNDNQYSGVLQQEGMLFIGLEKASPLQSVSLLFQFAEGSAADEDNDPKPISWSYLSNNEWRPLREEDLISDGTYGFQTTGIIKISLPADATNNNTIITEGLHWLMASVSEFSHRIPQLVNVVTQAVEVVFEDNENDQSHFDSSLPAGSINKLAVKVAEVGKVEQPFSSFDGKHKEINREYYTRVSERLRHKGRAVNSWDYEHLVLNRFPSIYKVKCITATDPNCLCREADEKTIEKTRTTSVIKYQVELTRNFEATEAGEKSLEQAVVDLKNDSSSNLLIIAYANATADYKLALDIVDKAKAHFIKNGIAAGKIDSRILKEGGILTIVDLEIFKDAEKPKALPTVKACCGPQVAPGHVLLVPISNLKNRNSINPLQPKTGRRVLLEIEAYLKKLTSPFVKVHAKNPVYEQIIVGFRVKFYTGTDKGFYLKKLNEEIIHYLTPWAFDAEADVQFGQKVYASSVINFIEERPYVDFITDFVMGVCKDQCCEADTRAQRPPGRETIPVEIENELAEEKKDAAKAATGMASPLEKGIFITGMVYNEKNKEPIIGASILIKDTATGTSTDINGKFSIELGNSSVLVISSIGYEKAEISYKGEAALEIALKESKGDYTEVVVVGYKKENSITEILAGICGCDEIEKLINEDSNNNGEIVAVPSTPRSILVSVPQHLIIPYQEPVRISPCEERKKKLESAEPEEAVEEMPRETKEKKLAESNPKKKVGENKKITASSTAKNEPDLSVKTDVKDLAKKIIEEDASPLKSKEMVKPEVELIAENSVKSVVSPANPEAVKTAEIAGTASVVKPATAATKATVKAVTRKNAGPATKAISAGKADMPAKKTPTANTKKVVKKAVKPVVKAAKPKTTVAKKPNPVKTRKNSK